MKRPAVFFDRDNTLIATNDYLGDPAKVVLVEGAANAVAKARQYGFKVFTFSNQSGVAKGLYDEAAVQAVNARMDELLLAGNAGAKIVAHAYCPDHPEAIIEKYRKDTPRRKPGPGMLLELAEEHNLDLSRSWVVGDAPRDIEAGHAAGCRTILFHDPNLPPSPATETPSAVKPDFVVASLKEAVELIGREAFKRPTSTAGGSPSRDTVASPVDRPSGGTGGSPVLPAGNTGGSPVAPPPASQPQSASSTARESKPPPASARMHSESDIDENYPDLPEPPRRRGSPGAAAAEADADSPELGRGSNVKIQQLLLQILLELKRHRAERGEFSVPKLLAAVAQVVSVTLLVVGVFWRTSPGFQATMLYAIAFQVMTIALMLLGKQK